MIITYIIRDDGEQMYNEDGRGLGQPPEMCVLVLRGMLVWLSQRKAIFRFLYYALIPGKEKVGAWVRDEKKQRNALWATEASSFGTMSFKNKTIAKQQQQQEQKNKKP